MTATARTASPLTWRLPLLAAVVCAIVWLHRHEPTYLERVAPVTVRGELGRRVTARNFAVTVPREGVWTARALRAPKAHAFSGERVILRTSGIWLSVPARIEALLKSGTVSAQLRSRDGLVYPSNDMDRPHADTINLAARMVAPKLPESGRYFFELPTDRLLGVHLQLFWGGLTPGRNDALLDIDLRIDAERARRLRAQAPALVEIAPGAQP